jgi:hypothetical protein
LPAGDLPLQMVAQERALRARSASVSYPCGASRGS